MTIRHSISGKRLWVMAKGYAPDEGGMQTYAREVAEAYARKGAKVTVFTQSSAGPRHETIGRVTLRDVGPGKGVAVPLRLASAMCRQLRSDGAPEFVHATTWRTALLPLLFRLPYALTVHGREIMYARGISLRAMRKAVRSAARVLAVSDYTRRRLVERVPGPRRPVAVAWNGVTGLRVRSPVSVDRTRPLILTLCRLEPRKNVTGAVRAAARCARDGMEFDYVICGRGPDREALASLVLSLGLENCVQLRGFVDQEEARRLYARADIFMHPQCNADGDRDFEGFGIAIADAMAAGVACIAGEAGGTAELICDGQSGFLVDGLDQAGIDHALARLLSDAALRQRMGKAARARALTHFRWSRHCDIALGLGHGHA